MKSVHLVITDLFLPADFAGEVCAGLHLPCLEKILARGIASVAEKRADLSLEATLCGLLAQLERVAPISAAYDGLGEGCWLRADPVHLRLQREQVVLLPNVSVSVDEAQQFCASLNEHFSGQGMEFFAPHPTRWYLRLTDQPDVTLVPLSQAAGRNIHGNLPVGAASRRWHQLFNEIQMLLFTHPLNEAREARGEMAVNAVWFWGNSEGAVLERRNYDSASSDEVLVEMLAAASGVTFDSWQPSWQGVDGSQLLVWTGLRAALQRGDLAAWREALQEFETGYAQPVWQALRSGRIARLQLDVLDVDNLRQLRLTRGSARAFWRFGRPLAHYSVSAQ